MVAKDHPRSRGVYHLDHRVRAHAQWIIPARAGFTGSERQRSGVVRDHPRSRGVYFRASPSSTALTGSSPLARGLRPQRDGIVLRSRIIPARAGFTVIEFADGVADRDHPRSRGVYEAPYCARMYISGSSPLARGLPTRHTGFSTLIWIIPARAGFTIRRLPTRTHRRGSSPLARGLRSKVIRPPLCVGIIPARAGFTESHAHFVIAARDHPRSRGVYRRADRRAHVRPGSSPLARGLQRLSMVNAFRKGIIPARAGFTVCHGE